MKLINFYQKYLSLALGLLFGSANKCRLYPTCSEYSKWLFWGGRSSFLGYFWIFVLSIYRILRCNGFFKGGIDYPIIFAPNLISKFEAKVPFRAFREGKNYFKIRYFLVQKSGNFFYIIKVIHER